MLIQGKAYTVNFLSSLSGSKEVLYIPIAMYLQWHSKLTEGDIPYPYDSIPVIWSPHLKTSSNTN